MYRNYRNIILVVWQIVKISPWRKTTIYLLFILSSDPFIICLFMLFSHKTQWDGWTRLCFIHSCIFSLIQELWEGREAEYSDIYRDILMVINIEWFEAYRFIYVVYRELLYEVSQWYCIVDKINGIIILDLVL